MPRAPRQTQAPIDPWSAWPFRPGAVPATIRTARFVQAGGHQELGAQPTRQLRRHGFSPAQWTAAAAWTPLVITDARSS